MFRVTVYRSSGRPFNKLSSDINDSVKIGSSKSTTTVARMITRQLKIEAPLWRGELSGSIHSKTISKDSVGIFMNYYGALIETGHRISPDSVGVPRFAEWIFEHARGSPKGFARSLVRKGWIKRNPWITRGLVRVADRIGPEAMVPIREEFKKRGFK